MDRISIVSNRKEHKHVSWQIVHEWEEDFVEALQSNMAFESENKKNLFQRIRYHKTVIKYIPPFKTGNTKIVFQMLPPYEYNYFSSPDYISLIIDAWKHELERVQTMCQFNKLIFLGTMEAVSELKNRNMNNVHYLPVSISKRYQRLVVPEKDIDLIMYGRNHACLTRWVRDIEKKGILHIVQCMQNAEGDFCAWSNKKGLLGIINERKELMDLIARSHYTVVSSPGNDPENEADLLRTGGYSPVTPRFFEAAVNYSVGIGIFPENEDYVACNIKDVCVYIDNARDLEMHVSKLPDYNAIKNIFDGFLEQHWTERRLAEIVHQLNIYQR